MRKRPSLRFHIPGANYSRGALWWRLRYRQMDSRTGASRAAKKRAKRKGLPPPEAPPATAKKQAAPVVEPLLHKRREAAFAAEPPEQRKKKKRSGGGSFQVVPVGYTVQARGGAGAGAGSKASQNTRRQAQAGALGSTGSAAARKADEIWFRKCGHGELLFTAYYRGQGLVPPGEWPAFLAALRRPLPLTFRVHGAPSEARASLLTRLERLHSVEPVSWAPRALGIWQAVGGLDKRAAAANAQVAANAFAAAGLPNTRGAGECHPNPNPNPDPNPQPNPTLTLTLTAGQTARRVSLRCSLTACVRGCSTGRRR